MTRTCERGAGSVLVIVAVAITLAAGAVAGLAGQALLAVSRARTAADLAALAAADASGAGLDPCPEAARVARANGARLLRCVQGHGAVTVVVETQGPLRQAARARARARPGPPAALNSGAPPPDGEFQGPDFRRFARMAAGSGTSLPLTRWAS